MIPHARRWQIVAGIGSLAIVACTATGRGTDDQDPQRLVEDRELRSSALPAVRLRVDSAFQFLGDFEFRIRDIARGKRFVFADVRADTVVRLVIAQFESILLSSGESYRYSFDGVPLRAGMPFRENAFAFSQRAAAIENPQGEAALTTRFLASSGVHLDDEVMSWRFLTVPDSARRHELIIFYIEPLAPSGARLADLYAGDEATPQWQALASSLRSRAESAFEVRPW